MASYLFDKLNYSGFKNIPGAVYTRSGVEYQQNASGVLVPFDENVPPISANVGVDVWEARTNSIINSTATNGAVAGVVGSGGSLPTRWAAQYNPSALITTVVGTGSESGLVYVDVRVSGTWGANAQYNLSLGNSTDVVASNGEVWSQSVYARVSAGSLNNINTVKLELSQSTSGGAYINSLLSSDFKSSLNSASSIIRLTQSGTLAGGATVARIASQIQLIGTNGNSIDVTFRIAAPQLELGSFPTPYIPTTNASATRGAASMYINAPGLLVPPFTVQVWAQLPALDGVARALVQIDDGSNTNRIFLQRSSGNAASMGTAGGSGGVPTAFSGKTGARLLKMAARVRSTELALACDGAAPNSASGVTLPPNLSRVLLGGNASAQFYPNGAIQRFQIINRNISDTELVNLTV